MNPFLPANYQTPSNNNYVKLEEGENRLRILSSPVLGWSLWIQSKPVRIPFEDTFTQEDIERADVDKKTGKKKFPMHFWAVIVWNYKTEKIQIFEITQKKIQAGIEKLSRDEEWGNPLEYDIAVEKTKKGDFTDYSVTPKPKKALPQEIHKKYIDTEIDLAALFKGEDPFKSYTL